MNWLRIGIALALLAGSFAAGHRYGTAPLIAQLERERAVWARGQADALAAEIKRSATIMDELRGNHAQATERAAKADLEAQAASAAAAAAHTMARRVRDASATDLLAARAKIESAGLAKQCAPAIEAADLRELMFRRIDAVADEIGSAAVGISGHADQAYGAASECAAAYKTVTR